MEQLASPGQLMEQNRWFPTHREGCHISRGARTSFASYQLHTWRQKSAVRTATLPTRKKWIGSALVLELLQWKVLASTWQGVHSTSVYNIDRIWFLIFVLYKWTMYFIKALYHSEARNNSYVWWCSCKWSRVFDTPYAISSLLLLYGRRDAICQTRAPQDDGISEVADFARAIPDFQFPI